jgi:hypothetical protein
MQTMKTHALPIDEAVWNPRPTVGVRVAALDGDPSKWNLRRRIRRRGAHRAFEVTTFGQYSTNLSAALVATGSLLPLSRERRTPFEDPLTISMHSAARSGKAGYLPKQGRCADSHRVSW